MNPWRTTLAAGLCAWVAACKPGGEPPPGAAAGGGAGGVNGAGGAGGSGGLSFVQPDARIFDPGEGGIGRGNLRRASKVDLLVVVDDSISMDDKHVMLKAAVPDLLKRLVNPVCTGRTGATSQPANPADPCPQGFEREFKPIDDLHVGVITSSLGGHEGERSQCGVAIGQPQNDGAHLLPTLPRGSAIATYAGSGFFKWDRAQVANPPGESDLTRLVNGFTATVDAVGEVGCGFESTLESWYRFLVDPEPPVSITYGPCDDAGTECLTRGPVDSVLLSQRRAFLRPDSLLLIVMLSDEDDCSIDPAHASYLSQNRVAPRPTSACASNPEDPCCYPCSQDPPPGCAADPSCAVNDGVLTSEEDPVNLTCFQPKRRFGLEIRYPVERYVSALRSQRIQDRDGDFVDNPIFAGGASAREVFLVGIVGVPWQDVATNATLEDPRHLRIKSSRELRETGGWDVILGNGEKPGDPHLVQSIDPRSGTNPITRIGMAPPTAGFMADPINGHERIVSRRDDMQYSCIFPLPVEKDCAREAAPCDCKNMLAGDNDPLCQNERNAYTQVQTHAKAFPPLRILSVMKELGDTAVVASICPKNVDDESREDYGYRAVIGAAIDDVAPYLIR